MTKKIEKNVQNMQDCVICMCERKFEDNTCTSCGGEQIDAILERDSQIEDLSYENKMMAEMLSSIGYSQEQIENICSGSTLHHKKEVYPFDDDMIFHAIKEPDCTTLLYIASGKQKNGVFSGVVYGNEGGGNFTNWYILEGRLLPTTFDENEALDEDIAIELLNSAIGINDFASVCETFKDKYTTYDDEEESYKINRDYLDMFENETLLIGHNYQPVNYGNNGFDGGLIKGYESLKEFSDDNFDFKKIVRLEFEKQIILDVDGKLDSSELIGIAIKVLGDNIAYSEIVNIDELRKYMQLIVDYIERDPNEESNLCNYSYLDIEVCSNCNKVLLPDDECYSDSNGKALCDDCSWRCEDCNNYFIETQVREKDYGFLCNSCDAKDNAGFYIQSSNSIEFIDCPKMTISQMSDKANSIIEDGADCYQSFQWSKISPKALNLLNKLTIGAYIVVKNNETNPDSSYEITKEEQSLFDQINEIVRIDGGYVYFSGETQECKITSYPPISLFHGEAGDEENIFAYEGDSSVEVENLRGDKFIISANEIENHSIYNKINIDGTEYSYELYRGAVDEPVGPLSHVLIDDGEAQFNVYVDLSKITAASEDITYSGLIKKNQQFPNNGILCYLWNIDSDYVTIDTVYGFNDGGDLLENKFQTADTYFDRACIIYPCDSTIKKLVSNAVKLEIDSK